MGKKVKYDEISVLEDIFWARKRLGKEDVDNGGNMSIEHVVSPELEYLASASARELALSVGYRVEHKIEDGLVDEDVLHDSVVGVLKDTRQSEGVVEAYLENIGYNEEAIAAQSAA